MRGSGLTRYRADIQGGGGLGSYLGNAMKDVASLAGAEARREGWKSLKSGGPLGLPSLFAGIRGAKRGAKRGVKRKANSAIDLANGAAKRAVKDLFG